MAILHIFADGTTTTDITGHVVKKEDAESFYDTVKEINRRLQHERSKNLRGSAVKQETA